MNRTETKDKIRESYDIFVRGSAEKYLEYSDIDCLYDNNKRRRNRGFSIFREMVELGGIADNIKGLVAKAGNTSKERARLN